MRFLFRLWGSRHWWNFSKSEVTSAVSPLLSYSKYGQTKTHSGYDLGILSSPKVPYSTEEICGVSLFQPTIAY
jgi:hypothetical protein